MNAHAKAIIAVIIGNTIFGFSFIFSKMALQITLPSVLIAVRFVAAFIALNLIVLIGRAIKVSDGHGGSRPLVQFSLRGKPLRNIILLALFQPILYFLCESYGIVYTSAAFAGTIIAVIPIAGIVFDVLIMRSKVRLRQIICELDGIGIFSDALLPVRGAYTVDVGDEVEVLDSGHVIEKIRVVRDVCDLLLALERIGLD